MSCASLPKRVYACALTCLIVLLIAVPSAGAATPPVMANARITPAAGYSGWAYLTGAGSTTAVWKWNAAGWTTATVPTGTAVWAAPFGSGWTWIWTNGAWHAVQTNKLSLWICAAPSADRTVAVGTSTTTLRSANSSGAAALQTLGAGTTLSLSCSNGMPDADTSRPAAVFALVQTTGGASGYVDAARLVARSTSTSGVYPPNTTLRSVATPNISRPGYLAPITDPTWGTRVMRIADSGSAIRHAYSKRQAWNSDGSLIMLAGGYPAALIDGSTYRSLGPISEPSDPVWANSNPNLIYGFEQPNRFVAMNARTKARTTLHTFSGCTEMTIGDGEGNIDNNDHYAPLFCKGANSVIVYDIQSGTIVSSLSFGSLPNNGTISPSGKYIVLNWEGGGSGSHTGVEVFDRNMTYLRRLTTGGAHADVGYDAFGNEVWAQAGANVPMWRLDNGALTNLLPNGSMYGYSHVSMRSTKRPGWVYLSHYDGKTGKAGADQVVAVRADGSGTVEVFAHQHHVTETYSQQPQAVPNRDGSIVMFASEWGVASNPAYAYIAGMRL